MEWVCVGSGPIPMVLVPPISDGLWTVRQSAWRLAWRYRHILGDVRLLALSRRQPIPKSFTTADHAEDYIRAVEQIGWPPSIWEGVSAGGPVSQTVAATRPDLVLGLILSVTMHRISQLTRTVLLSWRKLAVERRWPELYWSLVDLNARPRGLSRYPLLRLPLRVLPPPADGERFIRMVDQLLEADTTAMLPRIRSSTLILAGKRDAIVPPEIQHEMAAAVPRSELLLYGQYGHAITNQLPDYPRRIRGFVKKVHAQPTGGPIDAAFIDDSVLQGSPMSVSGLDGSRRNQAGMDHAGSSTPGPVTAHTNEKDEPVA
jgi:pimeloyl-ACP methyl ester carboxylesterase